MDNNLQMTIELDALELMSNINEFGYTPEIDALYGEELREAGVDTTAEPNNIIEQLTNKITFSDTKWGGLNVSKTLNVWFLLSMGITISTWIIRAVRRTRNRTKARKLGTSTADKWAAEDIELKVFDATKYYASMMDLKALVKINNLFSSDLVEIDSAKLSAVISKYQHLFTLDADGKLLDINFKKAKDTIFIVKDGRWTTVKVEKSMDEFNKLLDSSDVAFKEMLRKTNKLDKDTAKPDAYSRNAVKSILHIVTIMFKDIDRQTTKLYNHYADVFKLEEEW